MRRRRPYRDARSAGHGLLPVCLGGDQVFPLLLKPTKPTSPRSGWGCAPPPGTWKERSSSGRDVRTSTGAWRRQRSSGHTGEILQTPPMYSAIKHAGTRLPSTRGPPRDRARAAQGNHRPPDARRLSGENLTVRVTCSKGTYVRVLAEDSGASSGVEVASPRCAGNGRRLRVTFRVESGAG